MLEEKLVALSSKESLDGDDAFDILKLLQDHTTPILSLRGVGSSPAATSGRHHASKLMKMCGLATGRKSTGVESSRDGSVNREGEGRRSEGKSTPELENSSLGVPSRRTLFGPRVESHSEPRSSSDGSLGAKTPLNFNSLEEFPPMQSAAAIQTRKRDKNTSKPRRITLTSMQQPQHQSGTSTPHFTLPLNTSNSWSSHPAFVVEETTSSVPSPLSEERRLLRKERSRQLKKSSGSTTKSHTEIELTPSPCPTSQTTGSVPCTISSPVDSVTAGCRVSTSSTPLDTGIHQQPLSHAKLSTMVKEIIVKESEADSSPPHLTDECSTALTSTPLPENLSSGSQYVVSTERVSNREALDGLAQLYSKIILDRLVPNLTSEIHLLVQLLTCSQPASQTQIVPMGSEYLFESVENCVYFAVRSLYNIKNILTALDKATLQLLCDNVRIKQLEPRLSIFLSEVLFTASNETSSEHRSPSQRAFKRVPFQEDTDNVRNFPNMKVFHAFKKQRDAFYSALREWELHHNMPDWNFQSVLREKIRSLMNQPPELCSLHHLAILFQKQLLESCGYAAHMSAGVGGLEGPLKNLNPGKLIKLSERFQRQSHISTGTCPPPGFSETELFFSAFITTADSYIFNHNLSAALHYELLKLHSRCEKMVAKDIPEALYALRLLAKFLGFLDFLPYSSVASSSLLPSRTASPHVATLTECVCEARKKGRRRLSLTIPWVVDYMSMMDSHALQLTQYRTLLSQLMMVYRCVKVGSESVSTDNFLVLTCLGWLFEIPNISNSVFFEFLKVDSSPDTTRALPSHAKTQANLVTQEVLYTCCPYLAGIRVTLAEFAAGLQSKTSPIRKITPIPAGTDIPITHITPSSQLQRKLKENFFRSHPPNLKHVCDSVSERVSDTAILLVQSRIIPDHTRRGLRLLADWIANRVCSEQCNPNSSVDIEEIFCKGEAVSTVARVSEQTFTSVLKEATEFCKRHSETNTKKAIASLLCDTISEQVIAVAIGISTDWAVDQCMKWMHCKLKGIVYQEVKSEFDKLKKAVRAGGKANSSGPTLDTDTQHAAPFLDTPSSVNQHGHLSSQSSGQHSISLQSSKSSHNVPDNLPLTFSDRLDISENDISCHPISHSGPISQFMELATLALKKRDECPSAESVQKMMSAAVGVRVFIAAEVTVIEGGNSPHLLPNGVDELLSTSVQLAAHLVSHGLLCCESEEPVFVVEIISLWAFLKGLKLEFPIHLLLSGESITHYLQQVNKDVWQSVSYLLMKIIEFGIVTSDVVEALWMCRIKHSPPQQKQAVINGSGVFLAMWYDHDRRQEQGKPGVFREVCFVRLLSLVVNKSDISFTASLKNHPSLPFLTV